METKKEEQEKVITYCSICGHVCKGHENNGYILCDRCHAFIPIGSDSFYSIKGGDRMAQEKAKAKAGKADEEKSTEPTAKEIINAKAEKVKAFMDSEFKDSDKAEKLKVNHAYWKLLKEE